MSTGTKPALESVSDDWQLAAARHRNDISPDRIDSEGANPVFSLNALGGSVSVQPKTDLVSMAAISPLGVTRLGTTIGGSNTGLQRAIALPRYRQRGVKSGLARLHFSKLANTRRRRTFGLTPVSPIAPFGEVRFFF